MINIRSERLKVEILEPGEGRNRGVRFDRAGFVSQVWLDGKYSFCCDEPGETAHGGSGLCSEIRCRDTYSQCQPGERFAKFGVGLLLKDNNEPYNFLKHYDCQAFDVQFDVQEDSVQFVTIAREENGYGLCLGKRLSVHGGSLTAEYRYCNTGSKTLPLEEYCHNFISIESKPIGFGYCLDMPSLSSQAGKRSIFGAGTMIGTETGFRFLDQEPQGSLLTVSRDEIQTHIPFRWHLYHKQSTCSVTGQVSFAPGKVDIWSQGNIVAPEVINIFTLKPGEEVSYKRQWIFEHM